MTKLKISIDTTKAPEVDSIFQGPGRWSFAANQARKKASRLKSQVTVGARPASMRGIFASYYG